jgi:hypothetical protein
MYAGMTGDVVWCTGFESDGYCQIKRKKRPTEGYFGG